MPILRVGIELDWPTLGRDLIDWIETNLCHGPGDVEGEPLWLDDEFAQFLLDAYRLYPQGHEREGRRVVSEAVISRPKGRAKSELAGMIACAEAVGPVRFAGWGADGRPIGKPVRSPLIKVMATEEGQASNTYDNVLTMLTHAIERSPREFRGISPMTTKTIVPGGEIRPVTSGSASKDGGKETFAVADETHLFTFDNLWSMYRTIAKNLRKRKAAEPWMLKTTTMFEVGADSVAEADWQQAQEIADGRRSGGGFMFDHREGSRVTKWDDDAQVLASLNEAYGVAREWMDLERILSDDVRSPKSTEVESRRFWLNQRHEGSQRAFSLDRWDELVSSDGVIPDGALVVVGFDGSKTGDSTGLVVQDVETGLMVVAGVWESDGRPDWQVDVEDVDARVDEIFGRWDVWRLYADPPYWEGSLARWRRTHGERRVIDFATASDRRMGPAVREFVAGMNSGELSHDGDAAFRGHIKNCFRRTARIRDDDGRWLFTVQKERPHSPNKIDLAVCAVIANEARRDALASGAKPTKKRPARSWSM